MVVVAEVQGDRLDAVGEYWGVDEVVVGGVSSLEILPARIRGGGSRSQCLKD